jgi:hypothetical protein
MSIYTEEYHGSMHTIFTIVVILAIILAVIVFGRIFVRFVGLLALSNTRTEGWGVEMYQLTEDLPELEAIQKFGEMVQ